MDKPDLVVQAFQKFDVNGDGVIERSELASVLLAVAPGSLNDESVSALITSVDKNGDGLISYEEFLEWLNSSTEETPAARAFREATQEAPSITRTKTSSVVAEAAAALNVLQKSHCKELKALAHPPAGVDDVCIAIMHLLAGTCRGVRVNRSGGVQDATWRGAQKMLADAHFLDNLMSLKDSVDKGLVPAHNFAAAGAIVRKMGEDFSEDHMKRKSLAAASFCVFVLRMIDYYHLVAPAAHVATASAAVHTPTAAQPKAAAKRAAAPVSDVKPAAVSKDSAVVDIEDIIRQVGARSIQELKALAHPPAGVDSVCIAVMHLLAGIDHDVHVDAHGKVSAATWKGVRTMMAHPRKFVGFLHELGPMVEAGTVPAENISAARAVVTQMGAGFSNEGMRPKSSAAASLADFVLKILALHDARRV